MAWAGHSEYWTAVRFEALQRFRRRGGHLLSLSGNTAFWRVSIDLEKGVVEVRKHGQGEARSYGASVDPMLDNTHWHHYAHLRLAAISAGPGHDQRLDLTLCY